MKPRRTFRNIILFDCRFTSAAAPRIFLGSFTRVAREGPILYRRCAEILALTLALAATVACSDTGVVPTPGLWVGDRISFTFDGDAITKIAVRKVSCNGADGCYATGDGAYYHITVPVVDGAFGFSAETAQGAVVNFEGAFESATYASGTYKFHSVCCDVQVGEWHAELDDPVAKPDVVGPDDVVDPTDTVEPHDTVVPGDATVQQVQAIERTNSIRASIGVGPVVGSVPINQAAQAHANYYLYHCTQYEEAMLSPHSENPEWPEGFTGVNFANRMNHFGYLGSPGWAVMAFLGAPVGAVDVFVESFDRAIHARRAGNSVACWQGSNDAISPLLGLVIEGSPGRTAETLLPSARLRMPKALREELKHLRAGLNLRHTLSDLRTTLRFAGALAEWIGTDAGADLANEATALAAQLEADRFWNLRDVARWWAPHVQAGVLWRGRPPSTYASEGFWEMAEQIRLDRFVDLRERAERLAEPYPDAFEGCASCPIGVDPRAGRGDLDESYRTMPLRSPEALGATLEAIATSDGPVLVHCAAGVDRTGVLMALIGSWLGVPRERILADYLASGQLVEGRRLLGALNAAEAHGIDSLVAAARLEPGVLDAARRRLLG